MVRIKDSLMRRIQKTLVDLIAEYVEIIYTPELNFNSPTFSVPSHYEKPIYNLTLEIMPETRGLPVFIVRANFSFASGGTSASEAAKEDAKTMEMRDRIHQLLVSSLAANRLGVRELQRISDAATLQRETGVTTRMQIEFKAFARQGEYSL